MMKSVLILCSFAVLILAGCAHVEQYHFPQTQDKVALPVIVAFSHKYPNDVISDITEEKMFNGQRRYQLLIADSNNVTRTVCFTEDGKEVKGL